MYRFKHIYLEKFGYFWNRILHVYISERDLKYKYTVYKYIGDFNMHCMLELKTNLYIWFMILREIKNLKNINGFSIMYINIGVVLDVQQYTWIDCFCAYLY